MWALVSGEAENAMEEAEEKEMTGGNAPGPAAEASDGEPGASQGEPEREAERKSAQIEHELRERVKELRCLYGIARLVDRHGTSLDQLLQGTVDLLPPSWQYPEITGARLTFDGTCHRAGHPGAPVHRQCAGIHVDGAVRGLNTAKDHGGNRICVVD